MKVCRFVPLAALATAAALLLLSAQEGEGEALASPSWNAATGFSPAANPNGVWSYGFIPGGGSSTDFVLYDDLLHNAPGLDTWKHSVVQDENTPHVSHNGTASPITIPDTDVIYGPGQLGLHPGAEGRQSVARFTAPFNGTFQIDVTFSVGDPPGFTDTTTTDVHVLKNGLSLFDGYVDGNVNANDSEHYAGVQTLAAGDIIDFAVGFGDGNFHCDTTFLDATISGDSPVGGIAELPSVPSPSAPNYVALAALAAVALLALTAGAWYARRRWLG